MKKQMKKNILIILISCFSLVGFSQDFGLGIQSSFYTQGISAKYKMNDYNAIQAVATILGPYASYTGRYLKSFNETNVGSSIELQPYVLGSASLVTVTVPNYLGGSDVISSSFGYGLGAGISWSFNVFENFEISNEIAWTNTATTLTGYTWSYIHYGFGIHYFFGF